jgi:hypothetical protein
MFRQQSENSVATLEFGLASGDSNGSAQPRSMTCSSVRRARSEYILQESAHRPRGLMMGVNNKKNMAWVVGGRHW